VLQRFHLFEGAALEDLVLLEPLLERRNYGARELIFQEGDPAQAMYLVESGSVEIVTLAGDTCLATIRAGEEFGELPFFAEGERSAAARAHDASVVIGLPYTALRTVLAQRTGLALVVYRNACRFMARRLRQTSSDFSWLSTYAHG